VTAVRISGGGERPGAARRDLDATVKSARRVLEIFEYFASRQSPATVSEIAAELGYPRSSTSILVRSLVKLRYLQRAETGRAYCPTLRFGLVGTRIRGDRFSGFELTELMVDLQMKTGANVVLGTQNGIQAQYIQILPSREPNYAIRIGSLRPICRCAIGRALLAMKDDGEIARIVRRINNLAPKEEREDLAGLMGEIRHFRESGIAWSENGGTWGTAGVAVVLPSSRLDLPLALGLAGPIAEMRRWRTRFGDILLRTVEEIGDEPDHPAGASAAGTRIGRSRSIWAKPLASGSMRGEAMPPSSSARVRTKLKPPMPGTS
jgi:DNA-binding IclR family transcriptional regulator